MSVHQGNSTARAGATCRWAGRHGVRGGRGRAAGGPTGKLQLGAVHLELPAAAKVGMLAGAGMPAQTTCFSPLPQLSPATMLLTALCA